MTGPCTAPAAAPQSALTIVCCWLPAAPLAGKIFPAVSFRSPPTRIGCPRLFVFEIIYTMSEHFSLKCRFFLSFLQTSILFRNDSSKMLEEVGCIIGNVSQQDATRTFFAMIKRTFCRILPCGILQKELTVC
jgi:hypothetical protein